jgi:hypothetical protein
MPDLNDPRFASIASDPRFAKFPKRHAKLAVDKRFQGVSPRRLLLIFGAAQQQPTLRYPRG